MQLVLSEQNNLSDLGFHKVRLNTQQDESMISEELRKLTWYERVDLLIDIRNQNLLQSVGDELKQLNQLTGLSITFALSTLSGMSSIDSILNAIKSLFNLKYFRIDFDSQSDFFNSEEKLVSLPIVLDSLTNLESLSLESFVYRKNNLMNAFKKMVSLKELVLELSIQDTIEYQNLNILNQQINELSSITKLRYAITVSQPLMKVSLGDPIYLAFDKLINLQILDIRWFGLSYNLKSMCDQLATLQSLKTFKFQIINLELQDNFSQLLNTIFCLKHLEDLEIQLNILRGNTPIIIGEEVSETSRLRVLKLFLYNNSYQRSTQIYFCNQIKNIKCLEWLSIKFLNSFFSADSYEVLNNWSTEWVNLKKLEIYTFYATSEFYDYTYLFEFFNNRFQDLKQLSSLNIILKTPGVKSSKLFLNSLSQLKSLKKASFSSLYQNIANFQDLLVNCFISLQNLLELRLSNVSNKIEFLCLGKSFESLPQLLYLSIQISNIYNSIDEIGVFSQNLKYLKCLNTLLLQETNNTLDLSVLMGVQEVKLLLNGIKSLGSLQQLEFTLSSRAVSEILQKELYQALQGLRDLLYLTISKDHRKSSAGNIIKGLKRLVIF